jgi:phage-related protein
MVLYKGVAYQIELAQTEKGACPACEFLDGLSDSKMAKIIKIIKRLADYGKINNREQFKKVEDDIWEFKGFQTRMPCYFKKGMRVVITHGFIKKEDHIGSAQIERTKRIRDEYERITKGA